MASAFGHGAAAFAISNLFRLKTKLSMGVILLGIFYSILPDADVLAFKFGIPYESMWGHRGISHSIFFAVILAVLSGYFLGKNKRQFFAITLFLFLAIFSHSILDALTTGGKGVAFFAPFDNSRYFLPCQVIKVSPLGLKNFFSGKGFEVIKSELIWIGIPTIISYIVYSIFKSKNHDLI